ncbi:MAG: DnaJ domain-containing protein [Pseudomonadota bacterium]|nr:DnaJ domain-containing protein [Pseudomonadota bacterium]
MKLDSAYFDKIRIERGETPAPSARTRPCQAQGCAAEATHRAPKGRQAEGEYLWFCLDHVRLYNKSYNYFSGMNDAAVQAFQKDATIGHRPTWRMGVNAKDAETPPPGGRAKYGWTDRTQDPFRFFGDGFQSSQPEPERRQVHNMELKSLQTLGLDKAASAADVKARYKLLVKRHHPDANGGDRSLEDRLREIIQAYSYLKSVGFC